MLLRRRVWPVLQQRFGSFQKNGHIILIQQQQLVIQIK